MQTNVLIVFYSRYGNTRALAEAIAEGARQVGDVDVRLRRAADLAPYDIIAQDQRWESARREMIAVYEEPTNDDLEWADAIFFGTPTRYGNLAAEMKLIIDKTGPLWVKGALVDKVASVFVSTGTAHGGNESTLLAMLNPLMHLGMIIVSPGYADPIMFSAGTPYGASSVSGPTADQMPTENDLTAAKYLGKRTTQRALMLKYGKDLVNSNS
jgi:NAD(P)H dehydrogenase (quinone)